MGKHETRISNAKPLRPGGEILFPATLGIFVLISRVLCRGTVYFADGPSLIESILDKTYIIQPPGYWLFSRIAGLFPDPALAITTMNIVFSIAGTIVFYYTARLFAARMNAFLAALAYSTIFYIWFSSEVHSTYASQILFPVATFCALLYYDREHKNWLLGCAALIFAIGTGLRPSDGVFMLPMLLYFAITRMARKECLLFFSLIALMSLGWIIPTWLAFHNNGGVRGAVDYLAYILKVKSILAAVNWYSIANAARYALPMMVAFWPVLGTAILRSVRNWKDWRVRAMVIWIVPGSLFFIAILMSDPPYLNFLSAAILLLAINAPRRMLVTALWNTVLFVALSPIPSQVFAVNVVNCYLLQYTRYCVQHQVTLRLSEMHTPSSK